MLDTNVFDFIYEMEAIDFVNSLASNGKIELYVTHIQNDELEKIKDPEKKEMVKTIHRKQIATSSGAVGTETNRGFEGSSNIEIIGTCFV